MFHNLRTQNYHQCAELNISKRFYATESSTWLYRDFIQQSLYHPVIAISAQQLKAVCAVEHRSNDTLHAFCYFCTPCRLKDTSTSHSHQSKGSSNLSISIACSTKQSTGHSLAGFTNSCR
jgi:hypothetical protein